MCEQKLLFALMLFAFYHRFYVNAKICENIRVVHTADQLKINLQGCTKVLGFLQILLFEENGIKEVEFPELVEVTGFLLFYRVYGLTSIGDLFPNLKIIGGDQLFLDYAVVVFDLPNLVEIGLKSLRYVGRGSTRIERCPSLCYVNTIDWNALGGSTHHLHYFDKNKGDCASCPPHCEGLCWNNAHCQNKDQGTCENGCVLCNEYNQCERCEHYLDNGKCTTTCPSDKFGHLPTHTCVTREECEQMGYGNWFIFQDQCTKLCPEKHYKVPKNEGWCKYCGDKCIKVCQNAKIGYVQEADKYHGCTEINGNLEISMHHHVTSEKLVYGLSSVRIIKGYLRIYESHGITSLEFLKNLELISGESLYQDRYAVVIYDNKNLQRLWNWDVTNLNIKRGGIMFHYNPKLCRFEIETLVGVSHLTEDYTTYDVSPFSNGEQNICTVFQANIRVVDVTSTSARVEWDVAIENVVGYLVNCIEDPHENLTISDMEMVCHDLNEKGKFTKYQTDNKIHITGLNAYTNYAFYVQVSTQNSYFAGRTEIVRFKTTSGIPSVPQKFQVLEVGTNSIKLSWKPPRVSGGIIKQYEIAVHLLRDDYILIEDLNYCHQSQYLPESEEVFGKSEEEICCETQNFENVYLEGLDLTTNENKGLVKLIKVDNTTTEHVVSNLQYYSNYLLYLRVCNSIPLCSRRVIIYQRTRPDLNADSIPPGMSLQIINENSVHLKWMPPIKPNSYVASYLVTYKNAELINAVAVMECVTVHRYAQHGGFIITNLPPAKYVARISAVSLAGIGKVSQTIHFEIVETKSTSLLGVYLVLSGVIFGLIFIMFFYFYFKKVKLEAVRVERDVQLDRSDLELTLDDDDDEEQPLFGVVRNGIITSQNRPCTVKFGSKYNTKECFLSEVRRMREIKNAHHVVSLLGLVWQQQQPLLVMELMSWGDLKSLLINSRCGSEFKEDQIIRMAAEIADGLLYLQSEHIIHPDLAARNCLVSAGLTVKVVNFGLNKDIYEDDYYEDKTRGIIPVRWMAPESIADGITNTKSNVWSFGIVLWEIVTAAEKPYEELSDEEVMSFVIGQRTMKRPDNCSDLMYSIMCDCWAWKSANRINFANILEVLVSSVRRDFKLISFYNSSNGIKFVASLGHREPIGKDTIVRWKTKDHNVTLGVINEGLQEELHLPSTSSPK